MRLTDHGKMMPIVWAWIRTCFFLKEVQALSNAEVDELIEKARLIDSKKEAARPFLDGLHDVVSDDDNYKHANPEAQKRFHKMWHALHEQIQQQPQPRRRRRQPKSD